MTPRVLASDPPVSLQSFIRDVTAEESVRTAFFSAVSAVRGIAGASAPFELLPVGSPLHEQPLRHAALSPPISTLSSSAIDPPESFVLPALHVPKPSMREAHLTVTGEDVGNAFRAPPFLAQASNCSSEVTKAPGSPATVAFSSADMKRSARFARPCCGSWCMTEDEAEEAARWQEMIDQLPPPPEFPVHRGMLLFGVLNVSATLARIYA